MVTYQLETLKYPIGKFQKPAAITKDQIDRWINQIDALPQKLSELVKELSEEQLDTPYRPEGWTVRQVIHHIPDSHVNGYIRFKWTLTEDTPMIKAYNEMDWARLFDSTSGPVGPSLIFLKALHAKWTFLLKGLSDTDLKKKFIHPATNKEVALEEIVALYAWHGEHHYMHIRNLLERNGW